MTETAVPTAAALVVIPAAIVVGWLTWNVGVLPGLLVGLGRIAAVLIALVGLLSATEVLDAANAALDKLIPTIPMVRSDTSSSGRLAVAATWSSPSRSAVI